MKRLFPVGLCLITLFLLVENALAFKGDRLSGWVEPATVIVKVVDRRTGRGLAGFSVSNGLVLDNSHDSNQDPWGWRIDLNAEQLNSGNFSIYGNNNQRGVTDGRGVLVINDWRERNVIVQHPSWGLQSRELPGRPSDGGRKEVVFYFDGQKSSTSPLPANTIPMAQSMGSSSAAMTERVGKCMVESNIGIGEAGEMTESACRQKQQKWGAPDGRYQFIPK